jgi:hydrogenase maturation factor
VTRSPLGKLRPEVFERLIVPHLGAARPQVLQGPRTGSDAAIIRLGAGRVMAITTDPISIIPGLGLAESARLSCHLIASDLWTSGIPPAYAAINFNLPPRVTDAEFGEYWQAMSEEWGRLEVAVVTGHTGRYEGCDYPIIGAGMLVGVGDEGRTVGPQFIATGDHVIVTKDCAVEATAIVARLFPERLSARLDEQGLERARARLSQVSVVTDCRAALRAGVRDRGVSALHDATEGGVLGGLIELARACGCDLRIERARIPLSPEARAACETLGADPYWTLSEGTLIATARAAQVPAVLAALAEEGVAAADVGEVVRGSGVLWLTEPDQTVRRLTEPEPDPYWEAYGRAVREGWR